MCFLFKLNDTGSVNFVSDVGPNETGVVRIHGVLQGVLPYIQGTMLLP